MVFTGKKIFGGVVHESFTNRGGLRAKSRLELVLGELPACVRLVNGPFCGAVKDMVEPRPQAPCRKELIPGAKPMINPAAESSGGELSPALQKNGSATNAAAEPGFVFRNAGQRGPSLWSPVCRRLGSCSWRNRRVCSWRNRRVCGRSRRIRGRGGRICGGWCRWRVRGCRCCLRCRRCRVSWGVRIRLGA